MRMFSLTKLGRRVADTNEGNDEEMKVLHYLRDNKIASDEEIEISCGGGWTIRRLKERGLLQELTT